MRRTGNCDRTGGGFVKLPQCKRNSLDVGSPSKNAETGKSRLETLTGYQLWERECGREAPRGQSTAAARCEEQEMAGLEAQAENSARHHLPAPDAPAWSCSITWSKFMLPLLWLGGNSLNDWTN
jgi:hypothetical protein